jgi:hypothetical protein
MRTNRFLTIGLGILLCVTGCSRKPAAELPQDFHVRVQDAKGLVVGSIVQWRGVEVGRVHSVSMDKGLVRLDVCLADAYRGKLREGLRARPARSFFGNGPTTLALFGGDRSDRPLLVRGAAVPEAKLTDTLSRGQMQAIGLVVAALILFLVVLRLMHKMVAFTLALALLVFSCWFLYRQWQKHGAEFQAVRTEMRLSDMARTMLTEQAAQEIWINAQDDLAEAIREVGVMGKERLGPATANLRATLTRKADELTQQGKDRAAEEIRRLRDSILTEPDSAKP